MPPPMLWFPDYFNMPDFVSNIKEEFFATVLYAQHPNYLIYFCLKVA